MLHPLLHPLKHGNLPIRRTSPDPHLVVDERVECPGGRLVLCLVHLLAEAGAPLAEGRRGRAGEEDKGKWVEDGRHQMVRGDSWKRWRGEK